MTATTPIDFDGTAAVGRQFDRPPMSLQGWVACTLTGLLSAAALLVVWRRLAGALNTPLEPAAMLSVGLVVGGATAGVRLLQRHAFAKGSSGRNAGPRRLGRLMTILPSISVLALGIALTLPGAALGGTLSLWFLLSLEEFWVWRPGLARLCRKTLPTAMRRPFASKAPGIHKPVSAEIPPPMQPPISRQVAEPVTESAAEPPDNVLQQLTRSRTADGTEQLSGWLRMPFAPGQRTASIHVAFCPPFARTPKLSVDQRDGPSARVKTAQLLPYGARLDLKLATTAQSPAGVVLWFSARPADQ